MKEVAKVEHVVGLEPLVPLVAAGGAPKGDPRIGRSVEVLLRNRVDDVGDSRVTRALPRLEQGCKPGRSVISAETIEGPVQRHRRAA